VLLKPGAEGVGVIAGGAVRAVMEVCGIQNVVSKSLGSGNPYNVVKATLNGLQKLQAPEEIQKMRRSESSEETGYVGKPAA